MRNSYRLVIAGFLRLIFLVLLLVACGAGSDADPQDEFQITVTSRGLDSTGPAGTASPDAIGPSLVDPPEPTVLITVPPDVPSVGGTPSLEPQHMQTHIVREGDTLFGLARQYAVPMAAIQLANGMGDSTVVKLGESLTVPAPAEWEGISPFWRLYVVNVGETLSKIASAYDLEVADLLQVNDLGDADQVVVGQVLMLPLDGISESSMQIATEASSPTEVPAEPEVEPTGSPTAELVDVAAAAPPPVQLSEAAPPAEISNWPYETVRLINEVRAGHGLPPLIYNETLALAAQGQANDCAQRGWCGHTGSDGADIKTRILQAGYDPASWAECWAQRQTPRGAVEIWMDEVPPNDPHRRTLLTTWLSEIGVGVAETSWGYYFIADFGRP